MFSYQTKTSLSLHRVLGRYKNNKSLFVYTCDSIISSNASHPVWFPCGSSCEWTSLVALTLSTPGACALCRCKCFPSHRGRSNPSREKNGDVTIEDEGTLLESTFNTGSTLLLLADVDLSGNESPTAARSFYGLPAPRLWCSLRATSTPAPCVSYVFHYPNYRAFGSCPLVPVGPRSLRKFHDPQMQSNPALEKTASLFDVPTLDASAARTRQRSFVLPDFVRVLAFRVAVVAKAFLSPLHPHRLSFPIFHALARFHNDLMWRCNRCSRL